MELLDALGIGAGAMVAAVGGGGKTSLVFRLAQEARERGLGAVVTTTVKFTRPAGLPMPQVVWARAEDAAAVCERELSRFGAMTLCSGEGGRGRLLGFEPEVADGLRGAGRVVLVEADGSAHRPFKAPAAHEPVIPGAATEVVVCMGAQVLGKPLDSRWVHRPELAGALAGIADGDPVTPKAAAAVLLHPEGGRKGVPEGARWLALVSLPGPGPVPGAVLELAGLLAEGGYERAVIAAVREGIVYEVRSDAMVSAPSADNG
ncbi:MAG: hypothetical protein KatS3mg062_0583 [Tepidiforma sp.]|nr:MAG: hypothetical protein KatS3mg062_0583 [Tepidiforma sp.]